MDYPIKRPKRGKIKRFASFFLCPPLRNAYTDVTERSHFFAKYRFNFSVIVGKISAKVLI